MNIKFEEQITKVAKDIDCYYDESMETISGFQVAIDAELLLRKVEHANPLQSIQEGHAALDMTLQKELVKIIQTLKDKYKVTVVIVLQGLTPICAVQNNAALCKSHAIWNEIDKKDNKQLYNLILEQYGSRFYQQELINAAKETQSTFTVAPYLSCTQLVSLYQEKWVNCVFGSVKMLAYEKCAQVVVDFDLAAGTFGFIDRSEFALKLQFSLTDYNWATICIASGALYGIKFHMYDIKSTQAINQILQMQNNFNNNPLFQNLRFMLLQNTSFVLNSKCQLAHLSGTNMMNNPTMIYGSLFNNDVYYMMSQGLLEYQMLEGVSTRQFIQDVILAPSCPIKEIWSQKQFNQLYSSIGTNLLEQNDLTRGQELFKLFNKDPKTARHAHALWNFSEADIDKEMGRLSRDDVSFFLVLRWCLRAIEQNQKKPDALLRYVSEQGAKDLQPPKLQSVNQLVTMCYFQYLSNNQYISLEGGYLFGDLLMTAGWDLQEPVLVFLEMLKVFFPSGLDLQIPAQHLQFHNKNSKQVAQDQKIPVLLLSRVFSLIPQDFKNIEFTKDQIDYDLAAFNSYVNQFKQSMRYTFQTILYRLFRSNRASIDMSKYQSAIEMLAFQKQGNHNLGLVLKQIITTQNVQLLKPELKSQEVKQALIQGAKLWKVVYGINKIAAQNDKKELNNHFEQANDFLIDTLTNLGYNEVVSELR